MTALDRVDSVAPVVGGLAELWPKATISTGHLAGNNHDIRAYRMVPSLRNPRLLVPADVPRAAAMAVERVSAADNSARALARRLLALTLRYPIGSHAFRSGAQVAGIDPPSIESYLSELTGGEVRFAMSVGSARANRKPVLNVFRLDGSEVGFAKVGLTSIAANLVLNETDVLRRFATRELRCLEAPQVLAGGVWLEHPVLVMSSLRGSRRSRSRPDRLPLAAMRELAGVFGTRRDVPRHSSWMARLRQRAAAIRDDRGSRLSTVLDAFVDRHGDTPLVMGTWHGDWGPWNMAWRASRALVWDWERCTSDVPVGIDAAHFVAHPGLRRIGDHRAAADALLRRAPQAVRSFLARFGPDAGSRHEVIVATVHAYLLEATMRFMADAASELGGPVRELAQWHLRSVELVLGATNGG